MKWLALDIGGANLKVADGLGHAESFPFALWREPDHLTQELRTLITQSPPCDHLAITMTGELADCFANKAEGVTFILDAIDAAADGRHTRVYLNDGKFVTPQVAKGRPALVAAANWHALAQFASRYSRGEPTLLIDVGSTTTDIIPIINSVPSSQNRTDTARLLGGELLYAGVERTPICSLVSELPYRGSTCPIARELFATTQDVYLLLGKSAEHPMSHETADGRAATKACARTRMSKMICADDDDFNHRDAAAAAEAVNDAFIELLASNIKQVVMRHDLRPMHAILSGHGAFVAKSALKLAEIETEQVLLAREIGATASRCGPAHALAVLAREASTT